MPSFFEAMKRLAKGEPVYRPEDVQDTGITHKSQDAPASDAVVGDPRYAADTAGAKVLPMVRIEEAESHLNGDDLKCYAVVRNESPYDVTLDKMFLLNQRREIDATLRAGERKQFLVYDGEAPKHQNYHDADLHIKDAAGDYFVSHHDVFFDPAGDLYTIRRLQFSGLRDT